MPTTTELSPLLRRLRLSGVLESLEVRNRQAIESQMSYVEFLATTLQDPSSTVKSWSGEVRLCNDADS